MIAFLDSDVKNVRLEFNSLFETILPSDSMFDSDVNVFTYATILGLFVNIFTS